ILILFNKRPEHRKKTDKTPNPPSTEHRAPKKKARGTQILCALAADLCVLCGLKIKNPQFTPPHSTAAASAGRPQFRPVSLAPRTPPNPPGGAGWSVLKPSSRPQNK